MFVHALSGAASFAACLKLFRCYPLAVNRPDFRDHGHARAAAGRGGCSIALRHPGFEGSGYYVLAQDPADRFTLRPWHPGDGDGQEIRPQRPVSAAGHRVITEGMPVPRAGALLGWVCDRQVTAVLSVHHAGPGERPGVPQVRVLPLAGSEPLRWPPCTVNPLDDGRLWQYVDWGQLVDLAPLFARAAGGAFWVPSQNPGRAEHRHGCAVLTQNLTADDYWMPAGTYIDHWMLREGVPTPPASHLLTLPGTSTLARLLVAR